MESTITEAELFNLALTYGEIQAARFEIFVGGAIAMIVAVFITRGQLNKYLRTALIIIFSLFSYTQYMIVTGFTARLLEIVESVRIVTADQVVRLPMTASMLLNPAIEKSVYLSSSSLAMVFSWICCVSLMVHPKLLLKSIEK